MNLQQLFNRKIFRIPDYQRGYAWVEKQLNEFWDDLEEIEIEKDGKLGQHYTGTIFLEKSSIAITEEAKWILDSAEIFDVIDGQQRLTTIMILLHELILKLKIEEGYCEISKNELEQNYIYRSKLNGHSKIYKFSYSEKDTNYKYLLATIFNDTKTITDGGFNVYSKNLEFAKKFFAKKLESKPHGQLENIFKKISNCLQFDEKFIKIDLDVQAVFETMNNRGRPLTILEKLKNRLIYLTVKLPSTNTEDKKNLRRKINDAWGNIYKNLAKNPNNLLDEDEFLASHLSMIKEPKEAVFSEKLAEEKIFQMFCNRADKHEGEDIVSYIKIEDYILSISQSSDIWYNIHNSDYLIVKKILLLNNSREMKVFLLSVLDTKDNIEILNTLFNNTEAILFRNKVNGLWVFDERFFAFRGREIYNKEKDILQVNTEIQELLNQKPDSERLISSMNDLFNYVKGPKGFHRWGALKYFLFEYEEYLRNKYPHDSEKIKLDEFEETTIEHIIPQNWKDFWSESVNNFTKNLDAEKKEMAYKVLINTLGNLTILKKGKNSSLGNKPWIDKKERFKTGSFNEITISKKEIWTEKEILERGFDMLSFLETKIEGLKFSDDKKNKMLFYEDYIIKNL